MENVRNLEKQQQQQAYFIELEYYDYSETLKRKVQYVTTLIPSVLNDKLKHNPFEYIVVHISKIKRSVIGSLLNRRQKKHIVNDNRFDRVLKEYVDTIIIRNLPKVSKEIYAKYEIEHFEVRNNGYEDIDLILKVNGVEFKRKLTYEEADFAISGLDEYRKAFILMPNVFKNII